MAEGKVSDPSLYSLQRRCDNGFIGQTGANPRLTDFLFFYTPPPLILSLLSLSVTHCTLTI